ncbi:MAG: head-tail adaptor protein [Alphaproteobacteria bacterium]|nr:MAG: head-tail adaptor protein [Alphaproteobacteria bacterium]
MNISDLKHRLTIQEPVRTPDGGGGFTTVWQPIASEADVFASVIQISGSETLRDQQLIAGAAYRITLRYRADITASHRLAEGATVYNITALRDPDGAREWLEITATAP